MEKLNKENLLKIIKFWEYLNKETIKENIIKKIESEEDDYVKEIIEIRLKSLSEELKKKNFIEKTENKFFIQYTYENNEIFYIKENNEKILEKIKKSEFNNLNLYKEDKKIKSIKKENLEIKDIWSADKIIIK